MKHDLDLVRKILFAVEEFPPDPDWSPLHIEGYDDKVVGEHVRILAEAGFIEMKDASTFASAEYWPTALTWQGSQFLEAIRSDSAWANAKRFASETVRMSFPVLLTELMQRIT